MSLSQWPPEILIDLHRHNLLQELIVRTVRAQAVGSVDLTAEEIEAVRQARAKQLRLDSVEALDAFFMSRGLAVEDALWQMLMPLRVRKYAHATYGPKAEARFLDRKSDLDQVVYSLLRVKDAGLANELYLRLSGREATFADLASDFSEGHEKKTCGIVGPAPLAKSHPHLRDQLRSADVGVVNPPIAVEDWFLIVRLESTIPAILDDSMRQLMEHELFEADVQQQAAELLGQLTPKLSTPSSEL